MLRCREGLSPADVVATRCYDNGTWIPDPTDFQCTSSTSSGKAKCDMKYMIFVYMDW